VSRSNGKVVFELQQLSCMTPFVLVVDEDAKVTWASDAILRRFKKAVGANVSQLIEFAEPREDCSADSLSARLGQWCKFALLGADSPIPLAGRWFASGHEFILLATPEPSDSENLDRFTFDDFPESDRLVELFIAREENTRSLAEASSAAEALKQRSKDAEQAKHELDQRLDEINEQRRAILNMMKNTKQAEKMIRASEERLKAILDTVNAGIVLVDAETHQITDVNVAAARMMGDQREEIRGKTCHKFICPAEKGKCPIVDLGQRVDNSERVLLTAEGEEIPILKAVTAIILDGRDCLLESFVDLTKLKEAEQELKETHQRLVKASHKAGMAEVATDVLHNVGNVLNSINVSAHFIHEKLLNSRATNLKKVTDMVSDHADDLGAFLTKDERGKHIPVYLTEVAGLIVNEQEAIAEKLQSLIRNVDHIKQVIKSQQGYARAGGVEVLTAINDVIEDAVEINRTGLKRHGLDLKLELAELPKIHMDKQRVLQILVNLISNSKYALSESQKQEKLLTIRCNRHSEDRLRVEVVDNGVGIVKENMTRIFQHGFTTKEHGHGFGLHGSALAAKEMGGSLTAHSDGPGLGATFTLELPFKTDAQTLEEKESFQSNPGNLSHLS